MLESNTALLSRLKDVAWFRIGARLFVRDLVFCAHQKIWLSGLSLGKSKSDPDLVAEEKRQFIDNQRRRNAVEGKFGQGKRRFGLALFREKLALTQGSTIAMNILVMNRASIREPLSYNNHP